MKALAGNIQGKVFESSKFNHATMEVTYTIKIDGVQVAEKTVKYNKNFMVIMIDDSGKVKVSFQASPKSNANAFNKAYDSGKYKEVGAYMV